MAQVLFQPKSWWDDSESTVVTQMIAAAVI